MVEEKELEDIKKRSGTYCPFSKMKCEDNDCHLKDDFTGGCLFWLINSNLYHQNQKLDELNKKMEALLSELSERLDVFGHPNSNIDWSKTEFDENQGEFNFVFKDDE